MKNIFSSHGMTLTELLIATILIGIVMVGVVSVDYALRSMQKTSSSDSYLMVATSSALIQINRDAMRTNGDYANSGITSVDSGTERSICFRQDVVNEATGLYTPENFTDDQYRCYYNNSSEFFKCNLKSSPADPSCNSTNGIKLYNTNTADFFEIITTSGRMEYITFTLKAIGDSANPEHPINNPAVIQTLNVSPLSCSR